MGAQYVSIYVCFFSAPFPCVRMKSEIIWPLGNGCLPSPEVFRFLDILPIAWQTVRMKSASRGRKKMHFEEVIKSLHSPKGMVSQLCREPVNLHPEDRRNLRKLCGFSGGGITQSPVTMAVPGAEPPWFWAIEEENRSFLLKKHHPG